MPATLPSSELTPVAVTIAFALPRVITVPVKSMFVWSVILVSSGNTMLASLAAGNDSPVNDDSSTSKP